jgi:hypothetical protein
MADKDPIGVDRADASGASTGDPLFSIAAALCNAPPRLTPVDGATVALLTRPPLMPPTGAAPFDNDST